MYSVHFCKEHGEKVTEAGLGIWPAFSENGEALSLFSKCYSDLVETQRRHLFATFSQNSQQEVQYPTMESNALFVLSSASLFIVFVAV